LFSWLFISKGNYYSDRAGRTVFIKNALYSYITNEINESADPSTWLLRHLDDDLYNVFGTKSLADRIGIKEASCGCNNSICRLWSMYSYMRN
jgi:hypothetical protein